VTGDAPVRSRERAWQDDVGGDLQVQAYARAGTREVLDRQHRRIAALLAPTPAMRILDVGCGVGHLLAWLSREAPARYAGVDLSLGSVRRARAAVRTVAVADARGLPFRDGSQDAIVCSGAAHHFDDLAGVLREFRRTLTPGGRLVLHEPAASPLAVLVRRTLFRRSPYESPADLSHKHEFTHDLVARTLADVGFGDVTVASHDCLAYPLSGVYMALPWSRSRAVMRALIAVESRLERVRALRGVRDAVAWSVVFTARRRG
jgi:SAM-dependent methyltransferase